MISIAILKGIHISLIIAFVMSLAYILYQRTKRKKLMMINGIIGFCILLSGCFMLILGKYAFTDWVLGKLILWFLAIGSCHMLTKKFIHAPKIALIGISIIFSIVILFATSFR